MLFGKYSILYRFHKDILNGIAPYFVFGDFNFRCDTEGVVKVSFFVRKNYCVNIYGFDYSHIFY